MDVELVNQLTEINRAFYSQFSTDFSGSRSSERLNLEPFRRHLADDIRLLDAGCGNGRLAEALERTGLTLEYVGIDSSPELITHAANRRASLKKVHAHFRVLDLTIRGWSERLRDAAPFDRILTLAVLHHIPSFALRVTVLREMRTLLKPDGLCVMSNWQFKHNERVRKKVVPWATLGIDAAAVEEGDALLDWKRGGVGYRYVHLVNENEVEQLAGASGLQVIEQFHADAGLNLYGILTCRPS